VDAAADGADAAEDGGAEAPDGGSVDAPGADGSGSDGGDDDVPAPHDFRAHGGACNCALGEPAPGPLSLLLAAAAMGLLGARRRRAR
jgi:MYXO-CTERM domain-containing protein